MLLWYVIYKYSVKVYILKYSIPLLVSHLSSALFLISNEMFLKKKHLIHSEKNVKAKLLSLMNVLSYTVPELLLAFVFDNFNRQFKN